jgi:hypothetical protein
VVEIEYPAYWSSTRNSHAHGWSAGPTSVLTESILGIKLLSPLGKTWSITPNPGDLTHVEGGYETAFGKFVVVYDKGDTGEESLEIDTPEGTTGTLGWGELVGAVRISGGGRWRWIKGQDGRIRGGRVGEGGKKLVKQPKGDMGLIKSKDENAGLVKQQRIMGGQERLAVKGE